MESIYYIGEARLVEVWITFLMFHGLVLRGIFLLCLLADQKVKDEMISINASVSV